MTGEAKTDFNLLQLLRDGSAAAQLVRSFTRLQIRFLALLWKREDVGAHPLASEIVSNCSQDIAASRRARLS